MKTRLPAIPGPAPPRCAEDVLDVRGLRMRYGKTDVLNGVSFAARRGEVLALLGPNGAGKTTTIEILEGFRMRSAGKVSVLGADPAWAGEAWRARTGVVLQSWRDHAKWQVRELLAHLGRYYAPYREEVTILLATHDLDEAERLADRILILAAARSSRTAPPKSWRARFLASPRCAGAGTGSGSCTRRTTRRRSPGSCSRTTASRSRTWRYAGPAWRTCT